MKLQGEPKLHVRILSPTRSYFDGKALSVSANNKVGRFDILADHANFFSMLTEGDIVVDMGNDAVFRLAVSQGIIKVASNTVTFFIDIGPSYSSVSQAKADTTD